MSNPVVTFEMEDGGVFKAELYPEIAPNTVNNFVSLVSKGFYDGLIFHRVISGFMIQGGDPKGSGSGGPGYCIKGEFSANGFKNDLKHEKGVLSMARTMAPNSAGSQFFVMHEFSPHLDGQYAAFGKVIEGIDVVDKIASVRTDFNDRPRKTINNIYKVNKTTPNNRHLHPSHPSPWSLVPSEGWLDAKWTSPPPPTPSSSSGSVCELSLPWAPQRPFL